MGKLKLLKIITIKQQKNMNCEFKENQVLTTAEFNNPTDYTDEESFKNEKCFENQLNEESSEDENEDDDSELYNIYQPFTLQSVKRYGAKSGVKSDRDYPLITSSRTKAKKAE